MMRRSCKSIVRLLVNPVLQIQTSKVNTFFRIIFRRFLTASFVVALLMNVFFVSARPAQAQGPLGGFVFDPAVLAALTKQTLFDKFKSALKTATDIAFKNAANQFL